MSSHSKDSPIELPRFETIEDLLLEVVSPLLILAMVGSLVTFLIEAFYHGNYEARLTVVMGLFVMATVAIARISIEQGAKHAMGYSAPLAFVTFMAINAFVTFTGAAAILSVPINIGLLALVWWSTHQLTWDCTVLDRDKDASGRGLLEAMDINPFDQPPQSNDSDSQGVTKRKRKRVSPDPVEPPKPEGPVVPGERNAAEIYRRALQEAAPVTNRRPHGQWVIYFALAALPIYGMGQWLIPSSDRSARFYAFSLLVIYVASALGLLLNNSFMSIRRYLRQRGIKFPGDMAAIWMLAGGAMILVVLLAVMILPRPGCELSISKPPFEVTSPDRNPSRWSVGSDGKKEDEKARASSQEGKKGAKSSSSQQGDKGEAGKGGEKGEKGSGGKDGKSGDGGKDKGKSQGSGSKGEKGEKGEKSGEKGDGNQKDKQSDGAKQGEKQDDQKSQSGSGTGSSQSQQPSFQPPTFEQATNWLGTLLRWLFFAAIAAGLGYLAYRYRRELAEGFRQLWAELKRIWEALFGRGKTEFSPTKEIRLRKSFADYTDPFASGRAKNMSPEQLLAYSFNAMEAFARDRGIERLVEETPHEFVARMTGFPEIQNVAKSFVDQYGLSVFGGRRANRDTFLVCQRLWQTMSNAAPIRAAS